ncbi:MAG TPA: Ig-like domain repeat protein [Acidobacteriaceae bacterium]
MPLAAAHAQGTLAQTIHFLPVPDRPVTSAPFRVVALASSNLPVTLSATGPAMLDDRRLLTLTGVGQVTLTATQPGNTQYAPAPAATLTFNITQALTTLAWQPAGLTYGMPLSAAGLNATATAVPLVSAAADAATTSSQLNNSQINPGAPLSYSATATGAPFRYEGATLVPSTDSRSQGAVVPVGVEPPAGLVYRVAFTCDCQQFEYVVQSRSSTYWLWVDGAYTSTDFTNISSNYPDINFVRVQFPDKRPRQIKVAIGGSAPFFGVMTVGSDTVSAPQVPIGPRVIIFGDSWTGPTIVQPAIPPAQDGTSGAGYPQVLGEYFNWDWWDTGIGGEGFTEVGTDVNGATFQQRVLTDVCPNAPASIVIMGGVNDNPSTTSQMESALTTTFNHLASCLPDVPIYLYGPQMPSTNIEPAFAAVVPSFSNIHYADMGGQNWIYGDFTSAAVGNAYLYFYGHPTPLGHNYLAEKIADDLLTAFPSLAPTPYAVLAAAPAQGSVSYSAAASTLLPAGSNQVTATFTPSDAVHYAASSLQAAIAVARATTHTALKATTPGGVPTLAITITPQLAGTPTGSVTVSEGSTTLSTLPLSAGAATYAASTLSAGTHTLLISYPGDANFLSSSATTTVNITQPAPDFTLSPPTASLSLVPGAQGNLTLLVTPTPNLAATLTLACSGLPAGATCAFASGSALQVDGTPVQAVATFKLAALNAGLPASTQPARPADRRFPGSATLGTLSAAGLLAFTLRRRRSALYAPALLAFVLLTTGLGACGSSSSPRGIGPTTYTVQLTLTDAANPAITHGTTVTLTVL